MAKAKKRSRAVRSIVTGHLEKIGQEVFRDFRSVITDLIKGHQGIYSLYKKDKLYYVGKASDLKRRIKDHLSDRHQKNWTHFSLFIFRQEEHIKEIESLVLRIGYPKGNSVKGKLSQSRDLRPMLKRRLKDQWERRYKEIVGGKEKEVIRKAAGKVREGKTEGILKGLLRGYQRIYGSYKGKEYKAKVLPSGMIEMIPGGERYVSPSGAAKVIVKREVDGWWFWKYINKKKELVRIDELRK